MVAIKLIKPSYKWGKKPSQIVTKAVKYMPPGNILDIGSGDGRNALFLAKLGFKVAALEKDLASIQMLKLNLKQAKLKVKIIPEDIEKFKFNEPYSTIIAISVLHFLPKANMLKVINKIQNYTSKGGINIISAFTESNPSKNFPHLFKAGELKKLYSGWRIIIYKELITLPEKHGLDGTFHRHSLALLIAEKA
ncbi:MAG: methyltransferase domain-containing protein [Nanoarchaeota archaeon]|nr:methyltransferase domain-containing protein [Nanoarchaeota archaeon]